MAARVGAAAKVCTRQGRAGTDSLDWSRFLPCAPQPAHRQAGQRDQLALAEMGIRGRETHGARRGRARRQRRSGLKRAGMGRVNGLCFSQDSGRHWQKAFLTLPFPVHGSHLTRGQRKPLRQFHNAAMPRVLGVSAGFVCSRLRAITASASDGSAIGYWRTVIPARGWVGLSGGAEGRGPRV